MPSTNIQGWCVVYWGTRERNGRHVRTFPTYVQHFDWKSNAVEVAADIQLGQRRRYPASFEPFLARHPNARIWDVLSEDAYQQWQRLSLYGPTGVWTQRGFSRKRR